MVAAVAAVAVVAVQDHGPISMLPGVGHIVVGAEIQREAADEVVAEEAGGALDVAVVSSRAAEVEEPAVGVGVEAAEAVLRRELAAAVASNRLRVHRGTWDGTLSLVRQNAQWSRQPNNRQRFSVRAVLGPCSKAS